MYVVVSGDSGLLQGLHLLADRDEALVKGRAEFTELSGSPSMEDDEEPDYDPEWGGVSRGYVMHWWTDDCDVWVVEVEGEAP